MIRALLLTALISCSAQAAEVGFTFSASGGADADEQDSPLAYTYRVRSAGLVVDSGTDGDTWRNRYYLELGRYTDTASDPREDLGRSAIFSWLPSFHWTRYSSVRNWFAPILSVGAIKNDDTDYRGLITAFGFAIGSDFHNGLGQIFTFDVGYRHAMVFGRGEGFSDYRFQEPYFRVGVHF